MKTWKKFLEAKGCNIEDMEEKLHKDLDNDGEKGEPAEHQKKVLGKVKPKKDEK